MSMNLHANGLSLWQTPTDVTRACLAQDENGKEPSSRTVLARYLEWVQTSTVDRIMYAMAFPDIKEEERREYIENYVFSCVSHTVEVENSYWLHRNNVGSVEFYEM